MSAASDLALLRQALDLDDLPDNTRDAFSYMRTRLSRAYPLLEMTDKQRAWVTGALERRGEGAETSLNLISAGEVPRGREVAPADSLKNLPKKPPGRR